MAINFSRIRPSNTTDVDINTELVLNFSNTIPFESFDISKTDITAHSSKGTEIAIQNGIFQNNWTGSISILGTTVKTLRVICIRPINDPFFVEDDFITVDYYVESASSLPLSGNTTFRIISRGVITPPTYTDDLDLSGPGLPSGWVTFVTIPTFNGEMVTITPRSGIISLMAPDPLNGSLLDFIISDTSINMGNDTDTDVVIAETFSGVRDVKAAVILNAGPNPEIGLSTSTSKSRIPLPMGDIAKLRVRLTLYHESTEIGFIYLAKLYVGFNNSISREVTVNILQQTTEAEPYSGGINSYRIGLLTNSNFSITFSKIAILESTDPNLYYKKSLTTSVIPTEGQLIGGDKITILGEDLDNKIVDINFSDLTWLSDLSQDGGIISGASNKLELHLSSSGNPNVRSITRFGFPLSADFIGGSHLSFDINFDSALLINKPTFEVILYAFEIRIGNLSFIVEFVTSTTLGSIIRILNKNGYDIINLIAGTILFEQTLSEISKDNYNIRVIVIGSTVYFYLDGSFQFKSGMGDGPAVINMYNKSAQAIDLVTYVNNLILRPAISVGNNPVIDVNNTDPILLSYALPTGDNIGETPIIIRGINCDVVALSDINYLQPPQELLLAETRDLSLYLTNPILKKRL